MATSADDGTPVWDVPAASGVTSRAAPERRALALLDDVGEAVVVHDLSGLVAYLNPAGGRLLGEIAARRSSSEDTAGTGGASAAVTTARPLVAGCDVYSVLGDDYRIWVAELRAERAAGAQSSTSRAVTVVPLAEAVDGARHPSRAIECRVRLVHLDERHGDDDALEVWLTAREASEPPDARGTGAEELLAFLDHAPDIVSRFDRHYRHTYVNLAVADAAGLPREAFLGRTNREMGMPEALVSSWEAALETVFVTGEDQEVEFTYPSPDGPRSFHGRLTPARGPDGSVASVIGITRDVTESRVAQERMRRQAEFRASLVALTEASLEHGLDESFYGRLLRGAVRDIPGAQAGSLLLRTADDGFRFAAAVGFDLDALDGVVFGEHDLRRRADGHGPKLIHQLPDDHLDPELRAQLARSGPTERIKVTLSVPIVLDGRSLAFFNLDNFDDPDAFDDDAIDMARVFATQAAVLWRRLRLEADLRREREALEHLAFHDVVTGLPNRTLFHDRAEQALERSARTGRAMAVMLLDLDNFKLVNDVHGHDVGDALLRAVADRLRTCVRDGDTVARIGGDEFVVLLGDLERPEDAAVVADHIRRALRERVTLDGQTIQTSVSIGIDTYPGLARSREDLLKNADVALYRAKASGKDAFLFCTQEMNVRLQHRTALERDLRAALESEDLQLRFQPRIQLTTGRITAFEALVRWRHADRGAVPQLEFVRLAEETGLIRTLGHQVLRMACGQARAWLARGTPFRVAVNLSARQLRHDDLVADVARILREHDLPPRWLELELTESAAMAEVDGAVQQLEALQDLGVHLSLDDFGTGHSSLAYLRRLPFHALKIDRSFVRELVVDGEAEAERASVRGASVVQAVVALGKSFHLTVVAEGVETAAQSRLLRLLGCDEAQGYFFSEPVGPEAADAHAQLGRIVRND